MNPLTGSFCTRVIPSLRTPTTLEWLARGAFAALVVAYAFLLWYCFLGGWRAFA